MEWRWQSAAGYVLLWLCKNRCQERSGHPRRPLQKALNYIFASMHPVTVQSAAHLQATAPRRSAASRSCQRAHAGQPRASRPRTGTIVFAVPKGVKRIDEDDGSVIFQYVFSQIVV